MRNIFSGSHSETLQKYFSALHNLRAGDVVCFPFVLYEGCLIFFTDVFVAVVFMSRERHEEALWRCAVMWL